MEADARVLRTREVLRTAMVELAAESALDSITIRAITARAGIGYATFFRHYADKEALLAEIAEQLTRAFLAEVRPLLLERDRTGAARSLCAFVSAHWTIYTALIAGGSGDTVRAEMLRVCMATVGEARRDASHDPLDELLFFHLVSSILNLLAWWLRHPEPVSEQAMADIIERAVLVPVGAIKRKPPKLR